jgi:hypothetical protein
VVCFPQLNLKHTVRFSFSLVPAANVLPASTAKAFVPRLRVCFHHNRVCFHHNKNITSSSMEPSAAAAAAQLPPAAAAAAHPTMFARISASRPSPIAAFCGGAGDTTILSCCAAALLPYLSTAAVLPLRAACREARAAVAAHAWQDADTNILGSVRAWRACFPRALCARAEAEFDKGSFWTDMAAVIAAGPPPAAAPARAHKLRKASLLDSDLPHLAGLRALFLGGNSRVSAAALAVHLRGNPRLDLRSCGQERVGAAAFPEIADLLRAPHAASPAVCAWACNALAEAVGQVAPEDQAQVRAACAAAGVSAQALCAVLAAHGADSAGAAAAACSALTALGTWDAPFCAAALAAGAVPLIAAAASRVAALGDSGLWRTPRPPLLAFRATAALAVLGCDMAGAPLAPPLEPGGLVVFLRSLTNKVIPVLGLPPGATVLDLCGRLHEMEGIPFEQMRLVVVRPGGGGREMETGCLLEDYVCTGLRSGCVVMLLRRGGRGG